MLWDIQLSSLNFEHIYALSYAEKLVYCFAYIVEAKMGYQQLYTGTQQVDFANADNDIVDKQ